MDIYQVAAECFEQFTNLSEEEFLDGETPQDAVAACEGDDFKDVFGVGLDDEWWRGYTTRELLILHLERGTE